MIRCKRVYDAQENRDGQRVLVDRLWPRNKRKDELHVERCGLGSSPVCYAR